MNPESDPADQTVAEVVAYLDTASASEHARVVDAERAGKDRKGIVEHTQAADAAEAAEASPSGDGYTRVVVSS